MTGGQCPSGPTVPGIDVSEFQGGVNWGAVAASGQRFAVARISDGANYSDYTFNQNWNGIKAAGMIRGAYQFFEPGQDPVAQANLVISRVGRLADGDMPVMLDVEVTGGLSQSGINAQIHRWIDAVAAGTGKTPYIYSGAYFWDSAVNRADFANLPLNVAWYGTACPGVPSAWNGHHWAFHQFSQTGGVPGVGGAVDLDVFNGDYPALQAFAGVRVNCGGAPVRPAAPTNLGLILPGQGLMANQSISSTDGRFTLLMQTDGNLVEYANGVAMWSSNTNNGSQAVMQSDGNLVMYSNSSCPVWQSATGGGSSVLTVQNDGNIVVYNNTRAVWQSGTGGLPGGPSRCGLLQMGEGLIPGGVLSSCNGRYTLAMQGDGNLVLYHNGAGPIWVTRTGQAAPHLLMQTDGNLVVYAQSHSIWNARTVGSGSSYLYVQDDGNLVVYRNNVAVWASGTWGR